MNKLIPWGIAAVIALVTLIAINPFTVIGAGEVGVVTHWGAYSYTLPPGAHFVTPLVSSVDKFDVQVQKEQADASGASSDLQTVNTSVAVNYQIDKEKVGDLYVRIGDDYKSKVIDPAIQEVVKAVTAQYTAEELITKRADVTTQIQTALSARLLPSDILVSNISITNFGFSDSFNTAIEAKVTAEQNALAAKNKLDQVTYEAQQTVTTAKAQAEAIQIQAQAINSQGGADYVALQAVQKWNGVLPTQMIPGSAVPFINVSAK